MKAKLVLLTALALPMPAVAQEATEAGKEDPWSGKAGLGFLSTSGNTENTSVNAEFELGYATGSWTHQLRGRAIESSQDEATTAENYQLGWLTHYDVSEVSYIFGRLEWRKDRFAGVEQQFSQTLGYGRRLLDTERHTLNAEIGLGARQLDSPDGTTEDDVIARAGLDYVWQITENTQFLQDIIIESGSANTFTESITALKASLIGQLSMVASYTVRNNSDVPAGTEETDTFTALTLEYDF